MTMAEKTLEETVKNIDRNVEAANRKLSKLKDIFYMFSNFIENYRVDYYLSKEAAGYKRSMKQG